MLLPVLVQSQVTQINNNGSLHSFGVTGSGKVILSSDIDSSIWASDGTLAGTIQISTAKYEGISTYLNGKMYFSASDPVNGNELYVSDGTAGGTGLVKDINPGAAGSDIGQMTILSGNLFFNAFTAADGWEIWKSDGSSGGTAVLKDIVSGSGSSNGGLDSFHLFSNGSYLLFAAESSGSGIELWKSDGTTAGTTLLKDINSGVDSSNPDNFTLLNGIVLFSATDATHGNEIWKTDGTPGGTVLVKDIYPGTSSSTSYELFPGFSLPLLYGFHIFNNKAVFNATDGASVGEIWVTDGTSSGTVLMHDFGGATPTAVVALDAVNYPTKFFFPYGDGSGISQIWQSDGTPGNTTLFDDLSAAGANIPELYVPYNINYSTLTLTQPLFQGNKFFFVASTAASGKELWITDGTIGGTQMVKDINPGAGDGIQNNQTYLYTTSSLYFAADDGTNGNELWVSDGTSGGTTIVKNINTTVVNSGSADPEMDPPIVVNNKIFFTASDGDDPTLTDLYVVNGSFTALPLQLTSFTVVPRNSDALLQWTIQQAVNGKDFTVERSFDGAHFDNIGTVVATGNSNVAVRYSYTDPGIMTSGHAVVYYRLSANDQDGKSSLTNVITLRVSGKGHWNVRLLTNPVRDNLSLLLSNISGNLQLTVRDVAGRSVYTANLQDENGQVSLPVNLQSGVYFLDAISQGERQVIRFVK